LRILSANICDRDIFDIPNYNGHKKKKFTYTLLYMVSVWILCPQLGYNNMNIKCKTKPLNKRQGDQKLTHDSGHLA